MSFLTLMNDIISVLLLNKWDCCCLRTYFPLLFIPQTMICMNTNTCGYTEDACFIWISAHFVKTHKLVLKWSYAALEANLTGHCRRHGGQNVCGDDGTRVVSLWGERHCGTGST